MMHLNPFGVQVVDNTIREARVDTYIGSQPGRRRLAASMIQPLRERRDYSSVGRKTFLVEQIPDGAIPIYDKDPDVTAYVIGEEGESITAVMKPRRVIFPLFEIAALPKAPLTQIKERRYDLLKRMQDLGKAQIQAAEDDRVFSIMDAIAVNGFDSLPGGTNPDIPVVAPLSPAVLADAFAEIEFHDLRVARVYMNARDYADIRKFGRDVLDIESQATLWKTGMMATGWNAQFIVSRLVPAGVVYCCCEPEMFGRSPVRTELTVLSADNSEERTIGFSMFENLGIGAYNPRGLVRLIITR
ncbi:MAG: HK97-fold major capsid protein [Anaerolineaceae bacterium]